MACWDTTVLLDLLGRGGRRRQAAAEAKLRQLEHNRPHYVSRFTIAEVLIGLENSREPFQEREQLDRVLDQLQILEFDSRAMRLYASIFARLARLGMLGGIMDMLIASVAVANGQRLVTRNPAHFVNVPGLRVEAYS